MIYQKILDVSTLNPSSHSEGSIINHIQVDCVKLNSTAVSAIISGVDSIGQMVFALTFGVFIFGWVFLVFPGVYFFFSMMSMLIMKIYIKNNHLLMKRKDNTMRLLKNCLKNLKYVKMMVWEAFYFKKISLLRNQELLGLKKNLCIFLVWVLILWNVPIASVVAMLSSMFALGDPITVVKMNVFLKIYFSVMAAMIGIPYC
jgi:ATP-binding cassette subfamily C (CFTR/MRP) protein 1